MAAQAKKKEFEMDPTKQIEAAVAAGQETVEKVVKAGQEAAQQGYEQAMKLTQEQVDKAQKMLFGGYDDVAEFGKANYDAYVKSIDVMAKGYEAIGRQMFAFTQANVEKTVETTKTIAGCKTFNEVVDLQATIAREAMDRFVTEGTKITEMSMQVSTDAFAPIQERVAATVEKATKAVA